jgi:hypothetical protein
MIIDDFDSKTISNLNAALERTAQLFPERLSDHPSRSWLARALLDVARKGQTRLGPLSEAALSAAAAHFTIMDVPMDLRPSTPAPETLDRRPPQWMAAAGPHARRTDRLRQDAGLRDAAQRG